MLSSLESDVFKQCTLVAIIIGRIHQVSVLTYVNVTTSSEDFNKATTFDYNRNYYIYRAPLLNIEYDDRLEAI